jgi:zinc protease
MLKLLARIILGSSFLLVCMVPGHTALKIQEAISSQGIKAWLVEDHTIPVISLRLSFKAGSAYVPVEKEGLVEILTDMLSAGAGPYNFQEFASLLQNAAIELKFDCDSDEFIVSLKTTKTHQKEAFNLLKLALTQARFDKEEFEKIRASHISALKTQEKTPDYLLTKAFKDTIMKDHPYQRLNLGTENTLKNLTLADLRNFVKKGFTKDTLTIGVCGDINLGELSSALDNMFGELPNHTSLTPLPSLTFSPLERVKIVKANFPQSQALFVQKGRPPTDEEYIQMVLLSHIIGDSPSSLLFSKVRAEKGYAYSISTFIQNYAQASFFSGELGSTNSHVLDSLNLIREIWAQVKEKGVTQIQLEEAKSHVLGAFILNLTSSMHIAELIHYYNRWGYPLDYPERRAALIKSVTLEQINHFAMKFLDPQGLSFIVVGSPVP